MAIMDVDLLTSLFDTTHLIGSKATSQQSLAGMRICGHGDTSFERAFTELHVVMNARRSTKEQK